MSAFIVGREHVRYLVNAAFRVLDPGHNLSWRTADGPWKTLRPGDLAEAARVGQMLWDENVKSVAHRYPNDARDELPGPVGETCEYGEHELRMGRRPEPAQVVKAARCLEYQSCEHPEWDASEACAFLDALKDAAVSAMLADHERYTGKRLAWEIRERDRIRTEDLRVGDTIEVLGGPATVTKIEPYVGPLEDIIFGCASFAQRAVGMSLERGGTVVLLHRPGATV